MRSVASRVKVIGPAFALGALLSALAAASGAAKMHWNLGDFTFVWASVMSGPFSGLWAAHDWLMIDAALWAFIWGSTIVVHPIRSGWITGWISSWGVIGWFLLGFILTCDGV